MAGVQIRYLNQLKSFFFSKICLGILLSGKNFYHIFFSNNINNNVDLVRGLLQNSEFFSISSAAKISTKSFPKFFSLFLLHLKDF